MKHSLSVRRDATSQIRGACLAIRLEDPLT